MRRARCDEQEVRIRSPNAKGGPGQDQPLERHTPLRPFSPQVDIFTYLNTELSKRVEQVARLEAQIQELGEAQKKWEKETQEEFEGIQREQERVVGELNKKISDYKAELDDLAEFTKHKVGLTPQS